MWFYISPLRLQYISQFDVISSYMTLFHNITLYLTIWLYLTIAISFIITAILSYSFLKYDFSQCDLTSHNCRICIFLLRLRITVWHIYLPIWLYITQLVIIVILHLTIATVSHVRSMTLYITIWLLWLQSFLIIKILCYISSVMYYGTFPTWASIQLMNNSILFTLQS